MERAVMDSKMPAPKLATVSKSVKEVEKTAGFTECMVLGIGIAAGGLASSQWQRVLNIGIWEALIATLVVIVGYGMLFLALCELSSIVPFAGGLYGYVRCSVGPMMGYLTACCEMCAYMFYSIRTIEKITFMITFMTGLPVEYEAIWGLLAFGTILLSHLFSDKLYWQIMTGCTIFTFLVLFVFLFGSFYSGVDFKYYALRNPTNNGFMGTASDYMTYCYFPIWFFIGICSLPLAGTRVKDAEINIPKAMMTAYGIMCCVGIVFLFLVACQYPGVGPHLEDTEFVLQWGFNDHGLNLLSDRYIPLLLLVPTYASATGFMFAAKHQLANMAESGMTFAIFKVRWSENNIPIYAVLFVTVLQYVLFLIMNTFQKDDTGTFQLCCIAACCLYISLLCAFITFRTNFANMERRFTSPFGIAGACLGIAVFFFLLVSLVFFHKQDKGVLILTFMVWIIIVIIYYFAYVQYTQFFSKEEQDKFMKAYILNANKRKKQSKWFKFLNAAINYISCGLPTYISKKLSSSHGGIKSMTAGSSPKACTKNEVASTSSPQKSFVSFNKVAIEPMSHPQVIPANSFKRASAIRASFQTGALKLAWSGKNLDAHESRKVFEILHELAAASHAVVDESEEAEKTSAVNAEEDDPDAVDAAVAEQLVEHFPEHFTAVINLNRASGRTLAVNRDDSMLMDIEMGGNFAADEDHTVSMVRAAECTKDCT